LERPSPRCRPGLGQVQPLGLTVATLGFSMVGSGFAATAFPTPFLASLFCDTAASVAARVVRIDRVSLLGERRSSIRRASSYRPTMKYAFENCFADQSGKSGTSRTAWSAISAPRRASPKLEAQPA